MLASTNAAASPPTALPESPFRGIESFRYVDQPIFFARAEETGKLLRYVSVYRGVMFFGESGCGKSSLINAGFIPAIIAEGFTPDRLRVQPKPGAEIIVERISTKDTGEPPYLPSNFIGNDNSASRIVLSCTQLQASLQELRQTSPARRPLLIFDQFEEFATLFEEAPRGDDIEQAQSAQQAILKMILELQRDATLPVKLLFSFREDYLAKLSKLVTKWPDLSDQSLRLTSPGTNSLPMIIRGSFEKYPGSFRKELSPSLTSNLVTALEERNEGGKVNLSEVQITCLQLWKADDPDALFKSKGVQGLLEEYLSDSLNRLPENLREPAMALLSRMVTPSGTRNIISEYDLISQVNEDENISEEVAKQALRAVVQETKLVRRERRYDTYFFDIVSEFLVPWIRRKKFERNAEIERRKLEAIEKKKRLRAFAVAGLSLVLAALAALSLYYVYSRRTVTALAQDEVQRARKSEEGAIQARSEAEQQRDQVKNAYQSLVTMKAQSDAAAQKQYLDLNSQYTTLQKSANDQKNENEKLKQQVQKLQTDSDPQAAAKIMTAYNGLLEIEKQMRDLRSKLDPKLNNQAWTLCSAIQNKLSGVRAGLHPPVGTE